MKQMFKFLLKLFLFLLPVALFFTPAFLSGEIFNGSEMAFLQTKVKANVLYGTQYTERQLRYYKAKGTALKKPDILVLGDSRALMVRSMFFNDDKSFYNAGFASPSAEEMLYFLEQVNCGTPEVLIVSLSHFTFNENFWEVEWPSYNFFTARSSGSGYGLWNTQERIFKEIKEEMLTLNEVFTNLNRIGFNARLKQNGVLNDGSYHYGDAYARAAAGEDVYERMKDALGCVDYVVGRFVHGDVANAEEIYYLEQLIQLCAEKQIHLIAFLPPYAPSLNNAIAQSGGYGYMQDITEKLPPLFDGVNAELFDYTDVSMFGFTDEHFIDGFHAADTVYAAMFYDMAQKSSYVAQICDAEKLKNFSEHAYSNLELLESWQEYNALS